MEMKLKGPVVVNEERRADAAGEGGGGNGDIKKVSTVIGSTERSSMESSPRPSSSNPADTLSISQEDQLESTKAEMGEVREENERLKMVLAKIAKDYQSLQMKFFNIVQQEEKKPVEVPPIPTDVEEPQLISLSLGTSVSRPKKQEEKEKVITSKSKEDDDKMEKGISLGLDCKYQGSSSSTTNFSPDNSFEDTKEEEAGEPWPPSKMLKNLRNGDNEVAQQAHVKKARVSVRARCDAPTMNDGCQWRKYGQKIAKGNPCPRAYYRCTVAPACPVRKQVQRCAEDMSILITTYEGTHNHPLPISATAMASTTSAAASMLMSGSSTSQPTMGSQGTPTTAASAHGLNFGLSDNWRARQFYLPNPTISSNPSYPTITLDLTAPPSSSNQQASQFNRFPSTFTSNSRYPSTSFNFSSSESSTAPSSWSNGYLSYGTQPYNKSHLGSLTLGRQPQEPYNYQYYLQKATNPDSSAPSQHSLTDTIAKAITSDPSFQSALAAAITSYVGAHGAQGGQGEVGASHSLKWGDQHANSIAPYTSAPTGNGCASSYLNRTAASSSNPQQGNLLFLQNPVAFSSSKSASASPVENRENIN